MSIGRSFAFQRGRVSLGGKVVASNWKGALTLRSLPEKVEFSRTERNKQIREALAYFSKRWLNLTDLQRAKWEAYIKMAGNCASEWAEHETATVSGSPIPKRRELMSGFNAYVRSNMLAYTSGMSYPRDEAPLAQAAADIPYNVTLKYENGIATVTWKEYPFELIAGDGRIRVWARLDNYTRAGEKYPKSKCINGQIAYVGVLPSNGICTSTHLRGGAFYGNKDVALADIPRGYLTVRAETVVSYAKNVGAYVSAGSNIAIATMVNDTRGEAEMPKPLELPGLNA